MKIIATDLMFSYNKELESNVLKGVSLQLNQGSPLVLVGSNGSGKTTLLRILGGELEANSGSIFIKENDGKVPATRLWRQRNVESVYQNPLEGLFPDLTLVENVFLRGRFRAEGIWGPYFPRRRRNDFDKLEKVIERHVPFYSHFRHRTLKDLSGGEKQLFAIGLAVNSGKSVLLLDEPTASLDVNAASTIKASLKSWLQRKATVSLIVTHDHQLASDLGFDQVHMKDLAG